MYWTDPNLFCGTDSEKIRAAVLEAERLGLGMTVISRKKDAPEEPWSITEPISLPSDFTLVIDNCTLRMADGTFCNMITNRNCRRPAGRTMEGRQRNIRVEGRGNACISGGAYNGLGERNSGKNGMPDIWENNLILFTNVEGVTVQNLRIENQRWWALNFIHCADGLVRDLRYMSDCTSFGENGEVLQGIPADPARRDDARPITGEEYEAIRVKNADGIDLRVGCHDFLIENIYGFVEDDMIALTGLNGKLEENFRLEGASTDMRNITIRNVRAASICSLVRLLNQGGVKLYNIHIDGVTDIWQSGKLYRRSHGAVRLGDIHPYGKRPAFPEETVNITIENVISCGTQYGVNLSGGMTDVLVRNVRLWNAAPEAEAVKTDEANGTGIRVE